MTGKEFLQNNPLHLMVSEAQAADMREVLQRCTDDFHFVHTEENSVRLGEPYVEFLIYSTEENFATTYYHIGYLVAKKFGDVPLGFFSKNKLKS